MYINLLYYLAGYGIKTEILFLEFYMHWFNIVVDTRFHFLLEVIIC